jgi:hypothetical protein
MKPNKVALVFIGTDKYLKFLPKWYETCEDKFLPDIEKHYFVFSDGEMIDIPDNMSFYPTEHRPWPFITLLRFNTILKAEKELKEYDWVVFLDADMVVLDTITPEEIFSDKPYIGVHHPCHYLGMGPHDEPPGAFETNVKSKACIKPQDDTSVYFQGCLWGGRVPEVIDMMLELAKRTTIDLNADYIAVWHDESQMNKFFAERRDEVNVLHPAFAYPEDFASSCDFEPKIVHVSKDNSKYHK